MSLSGSINVMKELQGTKELMEGDKPGLGTQGKLPGESDTSDDT